MKKILIYTFCMATLAGVQMLCADAMCGSYVWKISTLSPHFSTLLGLASFAFGMGIHSDYQPLTLGGEVFGMGIAL